MAADRSGRAGVRPVRGGRGPQRRWKFPVLAPVAMLAAVLFGVVMLAVTIPSESDAKRPRAIVNPGPFAKNASMWSEISFRGVKANRAGRITVTGSRSGRHGYRRLRHGDNRGFSLVLKRRLAPREMVRVNTRLRIYGAPKGSYRFRTETMGLPRAGRKKPVRVASTGQAGFVTRPGLRPPRLKVRTRTAKASGTPLFIGSKHSGNAIYAAGGAPIWYRRGSTMDLRVQRWRGKPVLTWIEVPTKGSGLKRNTYMIANRKYKIIRKLTPGNGYGADTHEFRLTGRGTAYITAYHTERRNLRRLGFGSLNRVLDSIAQEIDLRTGRVIWEWHSLDHVPVGETYAERPRRPGNPLDYFHINTVADTPDGNVIVSGRSTNAAYKTNRRTGKVMWRLGGKRSTFRMGKGTRFSWQHDTRVLKGNRVSIYDNGDSPVTSKPWRKQSRGVVLKLNYRKRTARLLRRLFNPARPLASTQGNLQSLANGNWLVGWGGAPLVSEHGPGGKLFFDAKLKGTSSFYRAYRNRWHGFPRGRPAVVAKRTNAGKTRFWVSYNGDTRTRNWRVFAGPDSRRLSPAGNQRRRGFETTGVANTGARYVQLRGFDAKGRHTGRSKVVKVRVK